MMLSSCLTSGCYCLTQIDDVFRGMGTTEDFMLPCFFPGASFATVKLVSVCSQSKLVLHCLQVKDCSAYTNYSTKKHFVVEKEGTKSFSFEVRSPPVMFSLNFLDKI